MANARFRGGTRRFDGVVLGYRPTHRYPTVDVEMINGGLQMIATNVVVVDVNAIGGCLPKQLGTRTVVIVESGVEAELTQPGNLSVSASRTNDPRGTEQPC